MIDRQLPHLLFPVNPQITNRRGQRLITVSWFYFTLMTASQQW